MPIDHEPADKWHPIATAPRDGRYVDLWLTPAARSPTTYGRMADCRWLAKERTPGWFADDPLGTAFCIGIDDGCASHWRPRPDAPAIDPEVEF